MSIMWEGIKKAGLPVGTISGNYKKISDNPAKWEYITKKKRTENNTARRIRIANTATLITSISSLNVRADNYLQVGNAYLSRMKKELSARKVICKVNNKRVTDISKHIYIQRHSEAEKIQRTQVLPFVFPIIEKYGKRGKFTENEKGDFQEIVGRAKVTNAKGKSQNVGISVIVADNGKGGQTIKFVSVFVIESKLIKSYPTSVLTDACHTRGDAQRRRLEYDSQLLASAFSLPHNRRAVKKADNEKEKEIFDDD